jgi:hypothetical protein
VYFIGFGFRGVEILKKNNNDNGRAIACLLLFTLKNNTFKNLWIEDRL